MAAARGGALTTLQPNTASINRNKHSTIITWKCPFYLDKVHCNYMYTSIHNSELALPFSDFPLNYEKIPNYIEYVFPYRVFFPIKSSGKIHFSGKAEIKVPRCGSWGLIKISWPPLITRDDLYRHQLCSKLHQ